MALSANSTEYVDYLATIGMWLTWSLFRDA